MSQLDHLNPSKTPSRASWWTDIVGRFHEKLAPDYKEFTKRKLNISRVAMKISHLKEDKFELEHFYSMCSKSENFSKVFWGALK